MQVGVIPIDHLFLRYLWPVVPTIDVSAFEYTRQLRVPQQEQFFLSSDSPAMIAKNLSSSCKRRRRKLLLEKLLGSVADSKDAIPTL